VSDRKLAESIAVWQRQQHDAQKWKADVQKLTSGPGPFTVQAQRENEAGRDAWVAARARADELRTEVDQTRARIDQRQAELDAAGRFSGGKRQVLAAEIATLKASQEARISSLARAEAQADEMAVAAQQRIARATARDEENRAFDQVRAEKAAELVEASKDTLDEALDEQAYRERNGIEVADDPEVLAQEQAEREQALQQQREQQQRAAREMAQTVQAEGFGI